MYKLSFFVPEQDAEPVKLAVFNAGAGRIGEYEQCCWQTLGQGQFKPSAKANPHIGQAERLEFVAELKVEMVCADDHIKAAVAALKQAHPYEEPAYDVVKLESF